MGSAPLWRQTLQVIVSTFTSVMRHGDVGARLAETFHAAGLDGASVACVVPMGSDPASPLIPWLALTAQSLLPVIERTGAAALDTGMLEDRLRQEAAALHSQMAGTPQFCAWARKP